MKKVLIAAGGTAGHVIPALAVADALRERGAEVVWVGGERAEAELVPPAGYQMHRIAVAGLSRSNPLRAARAAALAARATARAHAILREERPDAVLGGGGYVAGPVGAAAVARRVPLVLTEADSHLGLTNRLLAPFARRVCLAFPLGGNVEGEPRASDRAVSGLGRRGRGRYIVTGRPVPPPATDRAAARARFGIGEGEDLVFVFGGSLGARSINEAAVEAFAGAPFRVLHAAGERDYASLTAPREGYDLRPYLDGPDFSRALLASDLAIARAGGSIFEICSHGRPAILIPYPHASADHQSGNARWMADAGAAIVLPDAELTAPRLAREAAALLADRPRLEAMAQASAGLARPGAARDVAAEVLAAAGAG
jgi:UDP-N-acetylglucosamine--N-acetylmuramyl-(pentapeptide) pyrophosphoryl-undecaprenol N-acetylglucosamine transferase